CFNFLQKAVNDRKLREEIFYKSQKWYNPIDTSIKEQEFEQIRIKAIEELPPKRKQIFKMSREEEKSYEEISIELGISISTVKNQMSKSLAFLRTYLIAHGHIYFLIGGVFLF
ncbi:MAG TPA: sigma-70 family RNA polymerase sigma factor, partial [Arenibacter sp.]|nr:sigma-70 family RNA polymerase sigma factor [Arenibacter sp.]